MGLFDFFKKKDKAQEAKQELTEPQINTDSPDKPEPEKEIEQPDLPIESKIVTSLDSDPETDFDPEIEIPEPDQEIKVEDQTKISEQDIPSEEEPNESIIEEPTLEPRSDGLFSKLKRGLSKTRDILNTDINELFASNKAIDDDLFDELEELLVTSDLGIDVTMDLMEKLKKRAKKLSTANELKAVLKEEIFALFSNQADAEPAASDQKPKVIMMVGVNGTGKTTTLGKLAMKYKSQGKKVLIGAADTFRAAAIEQVQVWADRSDSTIVKHKEGADPAAVAFDTVEASIARDIDIVLIDTAGRLHTQKNLMEELKKIKRSVNKKLPGAPHEVLMVLDATTGQNAISQATLFNEAVGLTQVILTKLDGTAKGGIVAAIANKLDLPITHIGVGEQIDDLQEFNAKRFVDALFD